MRNQKSRTRLSPEIPLKNEKSCTLHVEVIYPSVSMNEDPKKTMIHRSDNGLILIENDYNIVSAETIAAMLMM